MLDYETIAIILLIKSVTWFFIGKFHERYEWNRLISDGIIDIPENKDA